MRNPMRTSPYQQQVGGGDFPSNMSASSQLCSADLPPPVDAVLRITRFPKSLVVDVYNRLRLFCAHQPDDDVIRRSHSHADGATLSGSDATCTRSRVGNGATRAESDVRGRSRGDDEAVAQAVSAAELLLAVDEEIIARGGGGSNQLFPFFSADITLPVSAMEAGVEDDGEDTQQNHSDTSNAPHHGHSENPNPDSVGLLSTHNPDSVGLLSTHNPDSVGLLSTHNPDSVGLLSTHHQHIPHVLTDITASAPLNDSETRPNPVPSQPPSSTEASLGLTELPGSVTSPADATSGPLLSVASASVTVNSTTCSVAQTQKGAQTTGACVDNCSERQGAGQAPASQPSVNTSSSWENTGNLHHDSGEASTIPPTSSPMWTLSESAEGCSVADSTRLSGLPHSDRAPAEQSSPTPADASAARTSQEETTPTEVATIRQQERVRALRAENRRLKARNLCRQCRQRPVTLTLLPCGHFCFCEQCGSTFSACPVCHKTILADVRTFVS